MNHSCEPNCLSLRAGSNMLVYTIRPVRHGEELTHSYIPAYMLLMPLRLRAAHLHFTCECSRCARERLPTQSAACAAIDRLFFPPHIKEISSAISRAVVEFKMACAMSNSQQHLPDEAEQILLAGDCLLASSWHLLHEWPVAVLDVGSAYLGAVWNLLLSGDAELVTANRKSCIRAMASLWLSSACKLQAMATELQLPQDVCNDVVCLAQLQVYLLKGASRKQSIAALLAGVRSCYALHANSFICFTDDLGCLGSITAPLLLASPPLKEILQRSPLDYYEESCEECFVCGKRLPQVDSYLRCPLCEELCACSMEHLRELLVFHRRFCQNVATLCGDTELD